MMRALRPEIANTLYQLIADRVPEPPRHRNGGCRRRVPDRVCFEGIFWRFITGAAWETVEAMLGFVVSDTTLRSRRTEWVDAGVFQQLMEDCLAIHHQLIGVDANGIGLGGLVVTGSANDYPLLQPTLDEICARDWTAAIERLQLDRGDGYKSLPTKLDRHQINDVVVTMRNLPNHGRVPLAGLKRRWIVERTNSWLTNFRQLKINWDRTTERRLAALHLGLAIITLYRIVDHLNTNDLPLDAIR